jgi:glucose-6-phosphate 1-epimerase
MQPLPPVTLRTPGGASVEIAQEGAQILSWRTIAGEHLYRSANSPVMSGRAVRGGVPVCFPQFAARGPLVKHGFARQLPWRVDSADASKATLVLDDSASPDAWPHHFRLRLKASLADASLSVELLAENTGETEWAFTGALHTYIAVADVLSSSLSGLGKLRYEDSANGAALREDHDEELRVSGEVDRIYLDAPPKLVLQRPGLPSLAIRQEGFADTVVWNPGPVKAATLGDMPPDDWRRMLCVEAAVVQRPVRLAPGTSWRGRQVLALVAD